MRHYSKHCLGLALACLAAAPLVAHGLERSAVLAALDSVSNDELKQHVDFLADDTLEGRETGSRGGRAAGNFLMQFLEKQGIQPAGDNRGWFQDFNGTGRNVLAWKEGSDPALKNEIILIGAHYDHVGYGNSQNSYGPFGRVHNGADDNASGVAGLMEMISAVQRLPEAPKRSLLFAFWDSEERGLDGSKAWVNRPTLPSKRVRLAINLDMIGRLRRQFVEVYGTRTAAGLRELVSRSNREELDLDFTWTMREDSDHYSFYQAGIPTLMLHTGLHENYHRPSDDVHTLNIDGIRQMTRCTLALALNAAQAPQLPEFRRASTREGASKEPAPSPVSPPQPRLGVTWTQIELEGQTRLQVAALSAGLPAERAGIQIGDQLMEIDGKAIQDDKSARLAIMAAANSVTLRLARPGEAEPVTVTSSLLGKPVRVGVNWREDDAEPGVVVLTGVIPGSAASNAGLAPRDRLLEVNGERFRGAAELVTLLNRSSSPLRLTLERRGRIYSTELELAP